MLKTVRYPFGAPEFTSVFSGVRATRSLVLCVCFVDRCLFFCLFLLAIVLSVLRFTDVDYLPLISSNSSYSRHVPCASPFLF